MTVDDGTRRDPRDGVSGREADRATTAGEQGDADESVGGDGSRERVEEPPATGSQESSDGDSTDDGATIADAVRLVAGVAAIGGLGLTLVSGAVLVGTFATGDRSAVLRFGALAAGSVGLFLLWWGTAMRWSDDD